MRNPLRSTSLMLVTFFGMIQGGSAEVPRAIAPPGATDRSSKLDASSALHSESKLGRIREGSKLIDQIGEFQKSGETSTGGALVVHFYSKELHGPMRVLENLALERVVRTLDDNPAIWLWSVTGVVTEFHGENYLLITRAVLKAHPKSTPVGSPRTLLGNEPAEGP
jgi:hypothetical protein